MRSLGLKRRLRRGRQIDDEILRPGWGLDELDPRHAWLGRDGPRLREPEREIGQRAIDRVLRRGGRLQRGEQRPHTGLLGGDPDPERQAAQSLRAAPEQQAQPLVDPGARVFQLEIRGAAAEQHRDFGIRRGRGGIARRPGAVEERRHDRLLLRGDEQADGERDPTGIRAGRQRERLSVDDDAPLGRRGRRDREGDRKHDQHGGTVFPAWRAGWVFAGAASRTFAYDRPVELASWYEELKRRRVFRALIGYGIVAFAVLQVIEPVMHGLGLPDWVLSATVTGLVIGFALTLVLAWAFDLKGGRIERTGPAPRIASSEEAPRPAEPQAQAASIAVL